MSESDPAAAEAPPAAETPPAPRADGLPALAPDWVEQDHPEYIDTSLPSQGYTTQPVVGLGGSAGSLAALSEFFKMMPEESGMAFVVIVHLSPEHASAMPELLARTTTMRVRAAEDGDEVKPNCVYVIPPGKQLTASDGHLRLAALERERGTRVAVDLFFRSLADSHGPHAAAIVLSGADGDGSVGIKRIKERGGLTIAQDPEEAEHRGMPQSAIATGMVDWILRVGEMPGRLLEYRANGARVEVPPEEGPQPAPPARESADEQEKGLREVLAFLRARTGADFSCYKRATIVRRVSRRMQVNSVSTLAGYHSFLRTHPGEAGALLQDLLISVTNFFRDRDSFDALELLIPQLFENKKSSDQLRVWVPACATGEEAYSIAMLLVEHARKLESPPSLQVFACDLDESAILQARAGLFPEPIAADVSEERLRRFFTHEARGWRIRREVREMVLFATHDLLKDAPFSRMDLISCRNLLIYLNQEAQKRALDIFHFALRPGALLFLGSSESIEEASALFRPLDKKHRLFVQQPTRRVGVPVPLGPGLLLRALQVHEHSRHAPVLLGRGFALPHEPPAGAEAGRGNESLATSELHLRLAERIAPPSVIVNAQHEIVHLSPTAGRFLQLAGGEPTMNLLRVVHPMLRVEVRAALFQAAEGGQAVEVVGVPIELEGRRHAVTLRVAPARELAPGFSIVAFDLSDEVVGAAPSMARPAPAGDSDPLHQLELENESLKARLRDTVEQYEASTEEQKASNEELQAMNEELRSSAEELETSREELQSVNEELTTVNGELKNRVEELNHANSDLHNLMSATAIATLFLDRDLRIARYTPSAVALFRIIPSDVGRPLADLRHVLHYPDLLADAGRVLERLTPVEREVRGDGHWYLARLLPYRTLDDRIAGVVLTFVDVTAAKHAEEKLRVSEERLRLIVEGARDYGIVASDPERRVVSWNPGAEAIFGYSEAEIVGQSGDLLFVPEDRAKGDPEMEAGKAQHEGRAENERWHLRQDGSRFYGSGVVRPLRGAGDELVGFVKILRDLTEQKRAEEVLQASEERQAYLLKLSDALRPLADPLDIEAAAARVLGEHLRANRAGYAEMQPDGETAVVARHYAAEVSGMEGRYRLGSFGPDLLREFRAGRTVVRPDIARDPLLSAEEKATTAALSIGAMVDVPLVKDGRVVAVFFVHQARARAWSETELALIRETAERTWASVERARAEAALRASEEQFRRAIEDAPIPVIMHAEDGQVLQISRAWTELTGYTQDDIPSFEAWLNRAYGPGAEMVRQHMQGLFAGTLPELNVELEITTRAAAVRHWAFSASAPGTLRDGRRFVVGMALDITDRIVTEAALRRSEERLRTLADAVPQLIWTNSGAGIANYFNRRWFEYSGLSFKESAGRGWEAIVHADDAPGSKTAWHRALAAGEIFDCEYRLRGGNGAYRWFIGRNVPERDAAGQVTGWFGTATDIQDFKETEGALAQSRERLRLIVESAEEHAIITTDLERRVTSWNPGAERIAGFQAAEIIGQPCDLIFTPEDCAAGVPQKEAGTALAEGRALDERWHLRQDGSRFWGSGVMLPMRDRPGGQVIGLVKIFRDETERLHAKEALEQSREEVWAALQETERARAEAEAAGQAKDHFLAVLSHELRTPLTPIAMATQTLARRRDLPEPVREALAMIHRNVQLESRLVDDLLDVTKIERGKMELIAGTVEMHEVIQAAVETIRSCFEEKQQRLTLELAAPAPSFQGDEGRLQQVIWNLLRNASKFSPERGVIGVRTWNEQSRLLIEVSDSGIGIEPEALPTIFGAFTQANASITRQFGGLGLGLAIAQAIVVAHGGELRAASAGLGCGATFTISLPVPVRLSREGEPGAEPRLAQGAS